jgi:hypothetical protein
VRTPDEDGKRKLAFTWTPPSGAQIIHCALFACRPFIPYTKVDGDPALAISNYDSCVLAREIIEPASGVFDLTNPALEYQPPSKSTSSSSRACVAGGVRRISELAVGCWAYDTASVVAATPLVQIVGRGMYNYQGAFAQTCDKANEGKTCFVGDTDRLGACLGDACRDLCLESRDCSPDEVVVGENLDAGTEASALAPDDAGDAGADADASIDAAADADAGAAAALVCKKTDSYIGFCVPADEAGAP